MITSVWKYIYRLHANLLMVPKLTRETHTVNLLLRPGNYFFMSNFFSPYKQGLI